MAELLTKQGFSMYGTTIAKIEAGDRAVSIDEATTVADLFEVSLDSLLGRSVNAEDDLAFVVRIIQTTARRHAEQVDPMVWMWSDRARKDVSAFDFGQREELLDLFGNAFASALFTVEALRAIAGFELDPDAVVTAAATTADRAADDEAQT